MLSEAIKKDIEERFGSSIAYPKDCEVLAEEEITKQNITDLFSTYKIQKQCLNVANAKSQEYIETLPKKNQETCRFLFVISMNRS